MLRSIEKTVFFLLFLFLPTQLSYHFWPTFSYIEGIRIDYLSPTIYLTDIALCLLALLCLYRTITKKGIQRIHKNKKNIYNVWFLYGGFLVFGIILSKQPLLGWYGLLKGIEYAFFAYYVSLQEFKKQYFYLIISSLVLYESVIALVQFIQQSSIGGFLYYLGERTFNGQTPGIANASLSGQLFLRPYATFPHPNVLAGFLLVCMTLLLNGFRKRLKMRDQIILIVTLILGTGALSISMSRIALLLWVTILIGVFFYVVQRKKHSRVLLPFVYMGFLFVIIAVFITSPLRFRFMSTLFFDEPVTLRIELMNAAIHMIKDHPFFGVGLNNFLVNLPSYYLEKSIVFHFQPVHNIFLLLASQIGIPGFVVCLYGLKLIYAKFFTQRPRNLFLLIVVSEIVILGNVDHYFLTLQQGQLLLSFVIGMCWRSQSQKER